MDKIPCEDCITLPVCINTVRDSSLIKDGISFFIFSEIMRKCPMISKYIEVTEKPHRELTTFYSKYIGSHCNMHIHLKR